MRNRKNDSRRNDTRNLEILQRALKGEKHLAIALAYGITPNRIGQIVQREKRYHHKTDQ